MNPTVMPTVATPKKKSKPVMKGKPAGKGTIAMTRSAAQANPADQNQLAQMLQSMSQQR